jgi:hypothetical protein
MHNVAIGLCSFLFLAVFPGDARMTAPGAGDQITKPRRVGAANPDEKWGAESTSSKAEISRAQR